ncbi:MAG: carbon-nitrogen hydrolase family protein [Planctomycetota bacterium]|nr:carbon-nitrogen hydrolase family protein [Planctomycetota bacterium]
MLSVSVESDSLIIMGFRYLARELNMCLVFGFAERVSGDVFNCAVFIDHKGEICGRYHKMQFAEGYHPSWWFNRLGSRSRAFDTPLGRCGILICNDRWNPRLAEIPALDGAQFLVIPSFGSRSVAQDQAVLARGKENGLPVIEANVGVTLVVNQGKIAVVDRQEENVTFGMIAVGPRVKRSRKQRDKVERAFLEWRKTEMVRRYNRTQTRLKKVRGE